MRELICDNNYCVGPHICNIGKTGKMLGKSLLSIKLTRRPDFLLEIHA